MATLKHIKPFSLAKIFSLLFVLLGLVTGTFYALVNIYLSSFDSVSSGRLSLLSVLLLIILFPLIYAVIGFLGGFLFAFFYNFVSNRFGGIEVDLE